MANSGTGDGVFRLRPPSWLGEWWRKLLSRNGMGLGHKASVGPGYKNCKDKTGDLGLLKNSVIKVGHAHTNLQTFRFGTN